MVEEAAFLMAARKQTRKEDTAAHSPLCGPLLERHLTKFLLLKILSLPNSAAFWEPVP